MMQEKHVQNEVDISKRLRRGRVSDNLFRRSDYFVDGAVDFRSGPQSRSRLNLTLWSWMAALIDTLIITSMSCFCLIFFAFLVKTPIASELKSILNDTNIFQLFIVAFAFSYWVYFVSMRVFMGASLGESSCQIRVGQPLQRLKASYVLRIACRTTLLLMTGFIIFPILSLLFDRDILGDITGVYVYSLT